MYKILKDPYGIEYAVFKSEGNMSIPFDPANADYQEYLKWLAEGNEPLPADEPPSA